MQTMYLALGIFLLTYVLMLTLHLRCRKDLPRVCYELVKAAYALSLIHI